MARYVKRSIAIGAVGVSFILGFPATEVAAKILRRVWYLYGAYISMWLEQHAAFFVALLLLCTIVLLVYGLILFPSFCTSKLYDIDATFNTQEGLISVPFHSLRDHFHIIRERVDFAQLLPQLYQDKILSYEEEILKIQSETTRGLRAMCLIHMIERKGSGGVKGFIESLEKETRHLGHKDLALELKLEYPELFPPSPTEEKRCNEENETELLSLITEPNQSKRMPRLHLDSIADIQYTSCDEANCHKTLINWGLQIFPSNLLNNPLFISICLAGNYEFPSSYELVSPVYYFWSQNVSSEVIKFDMEHSVDAKTHKQSTVLSFVSADVSNGPPFRFSLLEGGVFNPTSSSGVISTKPQGFLAIVKRKLGRLTLRTDPQIRYEARVYYTWDTPMEYECTAHLVIVPAIRAWEKAVEQEFREAIPGDKKHVSFVKSYISIVIPDEGLFVKGWSLTCTSQKSVHYESVGKATNRLLIPECKISIKWVGEEGSEELLPVDLHCNIPFTGSHQRKSDSHFHIHSRSSQGKELIL